jgi:hypothetical protein
MSCQRSDILEKEHIQAENCLEQWFSNFEQWYPFIHFVFLEVPGNKRSFLIEVGKEHWELHQQALLSWHLNCVACLKSTVLESIV